LEHDLSHLINTGLIHDRDVGNLFLVDVSGKCLPELPTEIHSGIRKVMRKYKMYSDQLLLDAVRGNYRWTIGTNRNEPKRVRNLLSSGNSVYTIGYQGWSVDGFFNELIVNGIRTLIDVRDNPISRRYGFAKKTLSLICVKNDIRYVHVPELGIPKMIRNGIKTDSDYLTILDRYSEEILPTMKNYLSFVNATMESEPSVLMCMEAEVNHCHRSRIAASLQEKSNLPIVHFRKEDHA
jgi:hypothetical protein